jgi:putative DNA primase/helicase
MVEVSLKDLNDWTKAGASAEDIYAAFFKNELYKPGPTESAALVPSESLSIEQSPIAPAVESANQSAPERKLQGSEVILPDLQPWAEAVDGAQVLSEVAEVFSRYCALPEGAKDILALWCAYTHSFQAFQCSPRLYITSPEKGCGKTTVRDVIALFVPRSLSTENVSVAVLFRLIEKYKPIVLADECDAWLRDNEELRGLLNAGHRRGGMVYRCEGDGNEVRGFKVFAPVVLCGISKDNNRLPETLLDRSIVIRLDRATEGELQARFNSDRVEKETELCRKVARFIADNKARYKARDPVLPEGTYNRLADNWRPLFAVAEIAGGEWPERAKTAFRSLVTSNDTETRSLSGALLNDIHEVFDEEELFSNELIDKLCALEESPWKEFGRSHQRITPAQLAKQLKNYRIHSRDIHKDAQHAKGYRRSDFREVFKRYLTSPPAF